MRFGVAFLRRRGNRLRRTCRQEKSVTRDRMYCTSTTLFIRARSNLLRRLRVLLIIPFLQQIRALRRDAPQSFRTICTVRTIMSSLLLRLLTDASHSLFLLTALPALDASQIAAGVYDNCNTGPSFFWRSFALTCHTNSPCCHQNILLDRTVTSSGTRGRFLVGCQICTSGESASQSLVST